MRTYEELSKLETLEERFEYLRLDGAVGAETFGTDRYLNQKFYKSKRWRKAAGDAIIRDNGCEMGHPDFPINGPILVHHLNPITIEDVVNQNANLYDLNNLVCTSKITHNAIHYGNEELLPKNPVTRSANDTCPWKKQ